MNFARGLCAFFVYTAAYFHGLHRKNGQRNTTNAAPEQEIRWLEGSTMSKIRLTMACWNYDRTRALMEDRVPIDGVELTYLNLPVEETFFRMARHREFDVAEMSLSVLTAVSLSKDDPPFVAIPIFPSRLFRHSCIFVNSESNIKSPRDLIGKRVGVPEYQLTACVWIRGILQDEYDIPVSSVSYYSGGLEEKMRPEKLSVTLPPGVQLQSIPPTKTLSGRNALSRKPGKSTRCTHLACLLHSDED